jgi:hypothetical protein
MNNNLTAIAVILDSSGSMLSLMQDTLGGFNKFLADQKEVSGEAIFTLCTFSDTPRIVYDCVPLTSMENLTDKTYSPGGNTALLDAVGTTIESMKAKIAGMQEAVRPSRVVILIQTDGAENASSRYSKDAIQKLVKEQEALGWTFIFLGANLDAFHQGSSFGMGAQNSINYKSTTRGTAHLYDSVSSSLGSYRSKVVCDVSDLAAASMNMVVDMKKMIEEEDNVSVASVVDVKDTKNT